MQLPKFYALRQDFPQNHIKNVAAELTKSLEEINYSGMFFLGEKVAIAVGSRGIDKISEIVALLVEKLKGLGAEPFIVPAMGSHGGATAKGQAEVLESLGVTSESAGAPIMSEMDVVELGRLENGASVYMDKLAWAADAIVVINRIKPHTRLKAKNESGIMKMLSVGLGKHKGCSEIHSHGLYPTMIEAARLILAKAPIRLGIAVVENAYDKTYKVEAVRKEDFETKDAELLELAKSLMPSLPAREIDLLIVGEMGKNISGTGIDVNIIGRVSSPLVSDFEFPRIKRIVALDLTEATHGNALGMGLVDIIPAGFKDKIDFAATYANVLAVGALDRGKLPVVTGSDQEAIEAALKSLENFDMGNANVVFIQNTLKIDTLIVSENIYKQLRELPSVLTLKEGFDLEFDAEGRIKTDWW